MSPLLDYLTCQAKVLSRFKELREATKNYTIEATPDDRSGVLQQVLSSFFFRFIVVHELGVSCLAHEDIIHPTHPEVSWLDWIYVSWQVVLGIPKVSSFKILGQFGPHVSLNLVHVKDWINLGLHMNPKLTHKKAYPTLKIESF